MIRPMFRIATTVFFNIAGILILAEATPTMFGSV